jgi:membrane fusion protein, multidrug efflux system
MRTLFCIFLAALACACGRRTGGGGPSTAAVRVQQVEHAAGQQAARYSANIAPARRVDLAFKVGGYVDRIAQAKGLDGRLRLIQEGDRVTAGSELAALRKNDYSQRLDESNAALAEAIATAEQARLDAARAARLLASRSISQAEADTARTKADAALARVEGARVRVEQARTSLGDTTLRSPMDGVVLERRVEIGTLAAAGTVAFVVAEVGSVKAIFGVPDTVVRSLRIGAPQTVRLEAFRGQAFTGRISRIAPAADSRNRSFEIEVTIDNARGDLKPGMVASLELVEQPGDAAQAVLPLSAVVRAPGRTAGFAVFVVGSDGRAHVREVVLGELRGNKVTVQSGVSGEDRVVVLGAPLLADGEKVQIIPEGDGHVARN